MQTSHRSPVLLGIAAAGLLLACSEGRTPPSDSREIYIPGGAFWMGSESDGLCTKVGPDVNEKDAEVCHVDQKPRRCVVLSSFRIDETEVSNIQYDHCVARGYCTEPRYDNSGDHDDYIEDLEFDRYPVVHVNWYQAQSYCQWRGKRLPTEAEWEYAAKGREQRVYPWGESPPPWPVVSSCDELGVNFGGYWSCLKHRSEVTDAVNGAPMPVKPKDMSSFRDITVDGVLHMAGNVHEWVADWYADKSYCGEATDCPEGGGEGCVGACWTEEPFCLAAPADAVYLDPQGPDSGTEKVARGGSFKWDSCRLQTSYRFHPTAADSKLVPSNQLESLGFRCVRELLPDGETCSEAEDCASGSCKDGACEPSQVLGCPEPG